MAKREFIDVDTIKDLLACDLYNAEMKLIKLHGLCNTQAVTEQDIVKPYLKKLSNEVKNHAIEFELFGISDDCISIGILQGTIIREESEDKE